MKLKSLKPRLYNIMFHTHTVAGIVISFALFVIFYAGAFSLFRDELYRWENQKARFEVKENINIDSIIPVIKSYDPLLKDLKDFTLRLPSKPNPYLKFFTVAKNAEGENKLISYYINPYTGEKLFDPQRFGRPNKSLTYMGETIYRLHYFRQLIPSVGIYISGLVGFFFLFAIVSGVLIHWKNIISKFYALTTKGKWKQIWTNSHTSLGIIALPFQFIFAVTGAFLGLSIVLIAPSAYLLYGGDTKEIIKLVAPENGLEYNEEAKNLENIVYINDFFNDIEDNYPTHEITQVNIRNYGKEDGSFAFSLDNPIGIANKELLLYTLKNGKFTTNKNVDTNTNTYTDKVYDILIKLHYANYGGYFLKVIYFILAMITCYIIISGILIWQTARDNAKYTDKQRKFHHSVTKAYLSLCLAMFPAIALIFIANKIIPLDVVGRVGWVQTIFFTGWMALTIIGLFWNNYSRINRNHLFIGSLLALLIPIANGVVTKDWFWQTFINKQYYVFSVDFAWLMAGISGLFVYYHYLRKKKIA